MEYALFTKINSRRSLSVAPLLAVPPTAEAPLQILPLLPVTSPLLLQLLVVPLLELDTLLAVSSGDLY